MKKWLSLFVCACLLFCAAASAETDDWADDAGFTFADDGYNGSWVRIGALGLEFCLPEGWVELQPQGDALFAATRTDGAAAFSIRPAADGVDDLAAWGAANLPEGQPEEANFYDVLVTEADQALSLYAVITDDRLLAFDFVRDDEAALPRSFALQIVGSACAVWDDEDMPLQDGDDGDFDFGEAFEDDLG